MNDQNSHHKVCYQFILPSPAALTANCNICCVVCFIPLLPVEPARAMAFKVGYTASNLSVAWTEHDSKNFKHQLCENKSGPGKMQTNIAHALTINRHWSLVWRLHVLKVLYEYSVYHSRLSQNFKFISFVMSWLLNFLICFHWNKRDSNS